jgi:16S rRNA G966 N2-methylase RsmD
MFQTAARVLWRLRRGNVVHPGWQKFIAWQIKKIRESSADLVYNVDTFRWEPDAIRKKAGPYFYDPTPWSALRRIFRHIRLDFSRFTFVDMGAGKGRVVLAASAFPFTSAIGVELSPSLCRIAKNNLATFRFRRRRANMTKIVECNAAEFPIPETPCVFFFYNPFSYEIMNSVIENIVISHKQNSREIYLVCVGMSTIFSQITSNYNLKLRHSFFIPWGMSDRRTVYIFNVIHD